MSKRPALGISLKAEEHEFALDDVLCLDPSLRRPAAVPTRRALGHNALQSMLHSRREESSTIAIERCLRDPLGSRGLERRHAPAASLQGLRASCGGLAASGVG